MKSGTVEESVKQSICKNGFPEKIVRLPFKPVFQSCRNHGTSLKAVLENLRDENFLGVIEGNHIIFYPPEKPTLKEETVPANSLPFPDINPNELNQMQKETLEKLNNLSPQQMNEIGNIVMSMNEEEKDNIRKLFDELNKS
tara:strand:- start:481 stop:903 length:423 start_codon:yes stop_codon:yes gene_type:complete